MVHACNSRTQEAEARGALSPKKNVMLYSLYLSLVNIIIFVQLWSSEFRDVR